MQQTTYEEMQQLQQAFGDSARDFLSTVSPLSRIRKLRDTEPDMSVKSGRKLQKPDGPAY